MSNRKVQIGDLLIVTFPSRDRIISNFGLPCIPTDEYSGVIYKIEIDKWGHQEKVYVQWTNEAPPDYNNQHGYPGMNIQNMRSEFQIIRSGQIIK